MKTCIKTQSNKTQVAQQVKVSEMKEKAENK